MILNSFEALIPFVELVVFEELIVLNPVELLADPTVPYFVCFFLLQIPLY